MSKTNAETMTVRLPTQIANELIKLRDEENLPTIGSALQIYIENMKIERIGERLGTLEATAKKHTKQIDAMLDGIVKDLENLPGIIVEKLKETDEFI